MKLTSMTTISTGSGSLAGIERADIGVLERHDLGPSAQARMQLIVADIDGVDAGARRVRAEPR